jgi:hypothetical protein
MRRYHTQAAQRIRNRRKKEASKFINKDHLESHNFNRYQRYLGNCGNKHCSLCSWNRWFSKSNKCKTVRDKKQLEALEYDEQDYWNGVTQDFVDWEDFGIDKYDENPYWDDEDELIVQKYLEKVA